MEEQQVDTLAEILGELDRVRAQTADLRKKVSGPLLRLVSLLGGSVLPLLGRSVLELANRTDEADLRLQRLEAHTKLMDDGDVLEGLDMDPIDFIQGIVIVCELAKQSELHENPEVQEQVAVIQKTALDWKDYLVETGYEEVDSEEASEDEEDYGKEEGDDSEDS